MQNGHIFGIWLVHITASFNKLYASIQHAVLSSSDDVKGLVVIGQLLRW